MFSNMEYFSEKKSNKKNSDASLSLNKDADLIYFSLFDKIYVKKSLYGEF